MKNIDPAQSPQSPPQAPNNRTLQLTPEERDRLRQHLLEIIPGQDLVEPPSGTLQGNCLTIAPSLPQGFVDLLILDPPYNLSKNFNGRRFSRRTVEEYTHWLDTVVAALIPLLKPTASIYLCGDWFSSTSIFTVASSYFTIRNRITWEREKGRGARANWKNASEDIWFCTCSDTYTFNVEAVKLRRRVIAPYRQGNGVPKDWQTTPQGNFRDTHPSNLWTDISVPFWSMPENTVHPTQKSEKLIAKLILASTQPGDFVFDPFLGSGTTSVVARKLNRKYLGIELDPDYCLLAEKRLELAASCPSIQGFADGVFWERNTRLKISVGTKLVGDYRMDPQQSTPEMESSDEAQRQAAEEQRQLREEIRQGGEGIRKISEQERQEEEYRRQQEEDIRVSDENRRLFDEDRRQLAEELRRNNEEARRRSEELRRSSEEARQAEESLRQAAEEARQVAIEIRQGLMEIFDQLRNQQQTRN